MKKEVSDGLAKKAILPSRWKRRFRLFSLHSIAIHELQIVAATPRLSLDLEMDLEITRKRDLIGRPWKYGVV